MFSLTTLVTAVGIIGTIHKSPFCTSPERVEFVTQCILAYLRSALDAKDTSWLDAKKGAK